MAPISRRVVVAVNPQAAFGRAPDVGPAVVDALRVAGHEVTALQEGDYAALRAAARAHVLEAPDALVVVGGDGMVNLGADLVAGTPVPLGVVPSGTGNDMARGLGIPVGDTASAIAHLLAALQREPRTIDAGRVTGEHGTRWFASVLSAGFDALVNERANRLRFPSGPRRYTLSVLIELLVLTPRDYRLHIDGGRMHTRAVLVAIANNTSIGGGMRVAPDAKLDDGLFDVLIVRPLSRLAFLRVFPRVFRGEHLDDPRVTIVRARTVTVDARRVVAYADGERIGALPVDVELVPGALRVLA